MALTKSQIHHNVEIIKQILKEDVLEYCEEVHEIDFHKNGLYIELHDSQFPKEWIAYTINELKKEGRKVYITDSVDDVTGVETVYLSTSKKRIMNTLTHSNYYLLEIDEIAWIVRSGLVTNEMYRKAFLIASGGSVEDTCDFKLYASGNPGLDIEKLLMLLKKQCKELCYSKYLQKAEKDMVYWDDWTKRVFTNIVTVEKYKRLHKNGIQTL